MPQVTNKLSQRTIRRLRAVEKRILAHPEKFNINAWFGRKERGYLRNILPEEFCECGTTACIAGWGIHLFGKDKEIAGLGYSSPARELFGINPEQAERLFHLANWPSQFESRYFLLSEEERAQRAVARIEHFIKTNGEE